MQKSLQWLAVLLLALAVSACGSTTESGGVGSKDDEPLTFTYWGRAIFSDAANQMLVDRIREWGGTKRINVEVVMINQAEIAGRISDAIEAGTMPDALDVGRNQALLLSQQEHLQPLDNLYHEIGESLGGWFNAADQATDPNVFGGHRYGIVYSLGGNILFRRTDILEADGVPFAPATWEEMAHMSRTAQDPPKVYGMAFALSDVGDANLTNSMLRSWGGRVANDDGENCMIDSDETREFLTWFKGAWDDGLFHPGVITYDDAGDNVAYQSGQSIFIANPGDVFLHMRNEDPELGQATKYSDLPSGPVMHVSPISSNMRVIPTSTDEAKTELAYDLFRFLAEPGFMNEYYFHAVYGPAAVAYQDASIFSESAVHKGLTDLAINGSYGSFPDVDNGALAEYDKNFLTPRMIRRIVVDGLSIDESIVETQSACQEIYDKYR